MSASSNLGVVTVTYNSTRHLGGFIESLLLNKESISFVVFVDNNSSDDILSIIQKLDGHITYSYIRNSKNIGYSAAVNQGITLLREKELKYILVTNNDLTISVGGVDVLVRDMDIIHADVIGIPTTNDKKNYVLSNSYDVKTGDIAHLVLSKDDLLIKLKKESVEKTTYVQGGVVLFNETFFRKVGLYDPFLFFGGDELDFLFRVLSFKETVACYISLGAWDLFDHHTHHDGRFKLLKAKMMIQGVVYVLFKHGFPFWTGIFWNKIGALLRDLGKRSFRRHCVLVLLLLRAIIFSLAHIVRENLNKSR